MMMMGHTRLRKGFCKRLPGLQLRHDAHRHLLYICTKVAQLSKFTE